MLGVACAGEDPLAPCAFECLSEEGESCSYEGNDFGSVPTMSNPLNGLEAPMMLIPIVHYKCPAKIVEGDGLFSSLSTCIRLFSALCLVLTRAPDNSRIAPSNPCDHSILCACFVWLEIFSSLRVFDHDDTCVLVNPKHDREL